MLCVSEVDIAETEHPSLRHTVSWYPPTTHHQHGTEPLRNRTTRMPKGVVVGVGRMG